MTFLYKRTYKAIREFNIELINDKNKLKHLVKYSVTNVPFYKKRYPDFNYESPPQISTFDILRKYDIVDNEKAFISKEFIPKTLFKHSTSGTSGVSLNLYTSIKSIILEIAFIDSIFAKIDSIKNLRIAVLRGNRPKKGIYEYKNGQLVLSSYDLNLESSKIYLSLLKRFNINCLHVYPSSISILCKYIDELRNTVEIPIIKGIVASSETLSMDEKRLILNTFPNVKLIDIYGQNEHVALAYSTNIEHYNFIHQYSLVEFIDTGRKTKNFKIFEIVGTNFINKAMPLIRYGTEDYVEIDADGNVVSIIGRTQDFIINKDKEIVPCMVLTRVHTMKNVICFQHFQEAEGELEFKVVVNKKFNQTDKDAILIDIRNSFSGKINPKVSIVEHIDKTISGKQMRLIQKLNISDY